MTEIKKFTAKILKISEVAEATRFFELEILNFNDKTFGENFFSPGQFFLAHISPEITRAYSVCSISEDLPRFDLVIKILPNGKASNFFDNVKVGAEIKFSGSFGKFYPENFLQKKFFFATGTGISPIFSILKKIFLFPNLPQVKLFFGVRHLKNLFFQQKIQNWQEEFKNLSTQFCLSKPEKKTDFPIFQGRVTDAARLISAEEFDDAEIFLCGSNPMVNEMREILATKKVNKSQIKIESW